MASNLTTKERALRAERVALYAQTLADRTPYRKRKPKQYAACKCGRPAFRHTVPDREKTPAPRNPLMDTPKMAVPPVWYSGWCRGVRVTKWDKRRDAVGHILGRYKTTPPIKHGEKSLVAIRCATRPPLTWTQTKEA